MNENSAGRRMSFMIPLLIFVLFFVLCCGIMACVFLRAADETARAEQVNAGVQLCRNEAELLRSVREPMGEAERFYNEDYRETTADAAAYRLTRSESLTDTAVGRLRENTLTVYTPTGEELYSLDVTVYLSDGKGA